MGQSEKEFAHHSMFSIDFMRSLIRKPLSLATFILAFGVLSISFVEILNGNLYIARLNYVDATTLVMVAVLLLRGVTKVQAKSDLGKISIALISCLSFLYSYEAIYKYSFYLLPWKMPAPELREFLLQVAVGLTVLTGFAQRIFKLRISNSILVGVFIAAWIFWLAVGFPQLWDTQTTHTPLIELSLSRDMIYVLNRTTKLVWCAFYFLLYA